MNLQAKLILSFRRKSRSTRTVTGNWSSQTTPMKKLMHEQIESRVECKISWCVFIRLCNTARQNFTGCSALFGHSPPKKESNAFKSITEMDRNLEGQGLWDCDPKSGMLMLWLGFPLLSMLPAPAFEKSAQPAQQSKSFW